MGSIRQADRAVAAAGAALHADAVAAEAAVALRDAGVATILLRGASIARHLYDPGEARVYVDADLFVPQERRAPAEEVLRHLGYEHRAVLGQRGSDRPPWSSTWGRARDAGNVDLHWSLVGVGVTSEELAARLWDHGQRLDVLGRELEGLDAAATAVVVALHAAQHGPDVRNPVADLDRALERLDRDTWVGAAALAEELQAAEPFAAGLRLLPRGVTMAEELTLPETASVETILRAGGAPPMALGFDWLAQTPGLAAKTRLIAGKVVPDRAFMRAWSPLARGGSRTGLALAYAWRPVWLVLHSARAWKAWLVARRGARGRL
jgi:hypothetical protein